MHPNTPVLKPINVVACLALVVGMLALSVAPNWLSLSGILFGFFGPPLIGWLIDTYLKGRSDRT